MRWSGEDVNWSPIRGELPPVCLRIGSGGIFSCGYLARVFQIRCVDFFVELGGWIGVAVNWREEVNWSRACVLLC